MLFVTVAATVLELSPPPLRGTSTAWFWFGGVFDVAEVDEDVEDEFEPPVTSFEFVDMLFLVLVIVQMYITI
jgi:hypothetical protein